MKIAFGIIVFNGDFVLQQVLETIYPFANQILVSEGPVGYWKSKGFTTSTDRTNQILSEFKDPQNKIRIVHGQFNEKDDQCNAYIKFLNSDNDYIWNIDCDEIFKPSDIETIIGLIEKEKYTSVGFKSLSFFGGFDNYLTGFEENAEFIRIRKVYPGSVWLTHRPPTIKHKEGIITLPEKHLDFNELANKYKIRMYHYSYVFPRQVADKIGYYSSFNAGIISNYLNEVFFKWIKGNEEVRKEIEDRFDGVHEWLPYRRGSCRTKRFEGVHPEIIIRDMDKLKEILDNQLRTYL